MSEGDSRNGLPEHGRVAKPKPFLDWLRRPPAASASRSTRAARQMAALCTALRSERGEASGLRLASEVADAYRALDQTGLETFFDLLVEKFSPDPAEVGRSADAYRRDGSQTNLVQLQAAVEPPRQELFRRFNVAPGGTALLVAMRGELLRRLAGHPEWGGIDADLRHLFRSWFNRGFLVLERIEWRTSALLLERLIRYEAVHQIQGWGDLRRRLEADRRCYAFFHPSLPDEPLIFIEVALTRGLPAQVQPLLDPSAPVADLKHVNAAIFYSITNCQEGLRGISFGNFLIKHVVEDLGRSFPHLKTFATLSPVSGFTPWLLMGRDDAGPRISKELATLLDAFALQRPIDHLEPTLTREIMRLGAYYLLREKRGEAPLDPVARFHLANGARLAQLNWMGDTSPAGFSRSLGLTANYVYSLDDVERNHEEYAKTYRIVTSRAIEQLARQATSRRASP